MTHFSPDQVLDLWFPDSGHWNSPKDHRVFWETRMQGGMDQTICDQFEDLTIAAARGDLDHWSDTPRGRLALLIALDQFPRSVWRDTPAAFAQDIKATRLALEGVKNGHYQALPHTWERQFYLIAISHCEGPDHLDRMALCHELTSKFSEIILPQLADFLDMSIAQNQRVTDIVARFGRHPHRNPIYGRQSTPDEETYIQAGDFPHQREISTEPD